MRTLLFGPPGQSDLDAAGFAVSLLLFGISLAMCGISLAITLSFLLSPLAAIYLALAERKPFSDADWFRLAVLIASLAFLWLHAMVHLEDRYLAPVEPLAIISGLTGLAQAWGALRSRTRPRDS